MAGEAAPGVWGDLKVRLMSAAVMLVIGAGAIFYGGIWFVILIALCVGAMVWELWAMITPESEAQGRIFGLVVAGVMLTVPLLDPVGLSPLLMLLPVAGAVAIAKRKGLFLAYGLVIVVGGVALSLFRAEDYGLTLILYLVCVVVATDVLGYVVGRLLGGPKFWPAVSPKKTWSGTAGGWIGAALVGIVFAALTTAGLELILVSIALSFASQMGDIAESAIKRKCGIKDSSNLIPGHGGFLDRFDGLLGASIALGVVVQFVPGLHF